MGKLASFLIIIFAFLACQPFKNEVVQEAKMESGFFYLEENDESITVFREGQKIPIVTHNVKENFRPYLHPVNAPGLDISLTQYSPDHHKHQTGLYWGFTRVNGSGADEETLKKWFYRRNKTPEIQDMIGRDFFHFPGETHWRRDTTELLIEGGEVIKWRTVYDMLNDEGNAIMQESQTWTFTQKDNKYLLSLDWQGKALTDVTINEFDYGGMFLRMPWHKDIEGEAVNAARQRNQLAEGQRAMWVDVGMEIEGLNEWGHIAIFDHPDNDGFPTTWRVDRQLGVGPVRAGMGDWHIKKGNVATYRHQIVAYTGQFNDVELNNLWGDFAGDDGMYNTASLWGIAQKEGREAKFLTPEEAVQAMTIKEGYEVNVYASEPMITQPMAFCWDDQGRMWVAENRDYESRRDGFSNSGDSRILILEDEDGDGIADSRKVFLEGIAFPAAIAVGHGGLFVGAPPNFLFVPDADKDDKADENDIRILLTGWGIRDRHETINSLHWGPDGWLYGLEGFATPSRIRIPEDGGKLYKKGEPFPADLLEEDGVDINGGVWRYHPVKEKFEVVAHGFSNPWGIDYDSKGQLFISACVIPHLFHVIPGGIYHRQGGRHFNPYVYEDIQTIVDHRHRSAHGGARIYQSDAFPEDQYGKIFMANIHEHAVLSDVLTQKGSGYTASHGDDFLLANNAQWIGFSMEVGPEGGLYVLDWHDADICGNDVVHKETGRVFRIMPVEPQAQDWEGRYTDLNTLSDHALAELQLSKSDWHARRARVILQHRATSSGVSDEAVNSLSELLHSNEDSDYRLRALWSLHVSGALDEETLITFLRDKDEYIRAWTIQLICEDGHPGSKAMTSITKLARRESSPVVRMYLAAALQRVNNESVWQIANALIRNKEDDSDPNIPHMLWFGIEPLVAQNPEHALVLAKKSKISSISQKIARRLIDADQIDPLIAALTQPSDSQEDLIRGTLKGLEGRSDLEEPDSWPGVYTRLKSNRNLRDLADEISRQFGNAEVSKEMIATLTGNGSHSKKISAIKNLASRQNKELIPLFPSLLNEDALRLEAIRAIASYDEGSLGQLLLDGYSDFNEDEKKEMMQTMSSRHVYGWQLAMALKERKMQKRDIPAYVALQLKRVVGNGFVEIWGPIDDISGNVAADYNKYLRLITDDNLLSADVHEGRKVYLRTCGACHKLHDEGGQAGPELTGSNRTNTTYLLSNILEPGAELQDDYRMLVITTRDGRTYSGNVVAESDRSLTLRTVNQDAVTVNKSDIQSQELTEKSLMPIGLLNTLTDKEVLDLFAYLKKLDPPGQIGD